MSLSPFKQDIDELLNEFGENELTKFAEMKKVWFSRRFSYIFDAMPSSKLSLFMQSLYAHSIGYMVSSNAPLSRRLGGLYCLYCLHETQPFKPPLRIYISLGELNKLTQLVIDAKAQGIKDVISLVSRMLENNMFLFGAVDINEGSTTQLVDELTQLQNDRVQHAYKKLIPETRLKQFLHMDLGNKFDLHTMKKMSAEYAKAKKQAIQEAGKVVNVEDIQHISDDKEFIGDVMDNIGGNWNVQKEMFYQQTGLYQHPAQEQEQQHQNHKEENEDGDNDDFSRQLELQLYEEEPQG
ncbi:uncharacterized protein LOC126685740 [Mercurialis annua]|uniref:uncharacterized protein LOC126685740 n=1 Tax=Mercurialis annua TaxID=3986 RepID=UPI00215FEB32|nr:uncharacterized protein LOC126685740 [Mercurialis annua]